MVGRFGIPLGYLVCLPRGFSRNSSSKQATTQKPTGFPVFLQDTSEKKMMGVEGEGKIIEGGWWME